MTVPAARPALAVLALAVTAPALAGQCPADRVRANPPTGAPTAGNAVTDSVLGAVDHGTEINVDGRRLRTRPLVVQPGGVVPLHGHADRFALIITASGEINEHRSTCAAPILHRAGELNRGADSISHYWTIDSIKPAVLLSSDVFHGE